MILRNLKTIDDRLVDLFPGEKNCRDEVDGLDLEGALVFPGLVNSHDHLDFNLYPQFGERKYEHYAEWGADLHARFQKDISRVQEIHLNIRALWGLYKNLLCGVTTVVNHGARLSFISPPVRVYQQVQSLHSVRFERYWKIKLNNPLQRNRPCVIHCGEGLNREAEREISQLIQWNYLQRELIGVHGIAMTPSQSAHFEALVWCPESNFFLFDQTARIDSLKTRILFGTDSTLTSGWNLWEHLRHAREKTGVTVMDLYRMLTYTAGQVWHLPGYASEESFPADLVVARPGIDGSGEEQFISLDPSDILLVIRQGEVRLFDESLLSALEKSGLKSKGFFPCLVADRVKMVQGNLPLLVQEIKKYLPEWMLPTGLVSQSQPS
jgi:cytosine/adenosine deaminase-related metal-dependent hydrolase